MKIKVVFTMLVFCFYFIFLNNLTGAQNIKFNKLSSKTFTLNRIYYMTVFDESNINSTEIFNSLPIHVIIEQTEKKYGINIDTSLFSDNIIQIKSYNLGMRNFFVECETEEIQRISISFYKFNQYILSVEVDLSVSEKNKKVSKTRFSLKIPYQPITSP